MSYKFLSRGLGPIIYRPHLATLRMQGSINCRHQAALRLQAYMCNYTNEWVKNRT